MTVTLETPRLILRQPEMGDWEACAAFLGSDRAKHMGGPYGKRDAWRAFAHAVGHWQLRGFGMFVATLKETGAPVALAGPWYPICHPEREISWAVWTPEAEGKGYAFEAATTARDWAFTELGWDTAVSYIAPDNARSIALAERLGCTLDETAEKPDSDLPPCQVWRHPAPDADGGPEAYA